MLRWVAFRRFEGVGARRLERDDVRTTAALALLLTELRSALTTAVPPLIVNAARLVWPVAVVEVMLPRLKAVLTVNVPALAALVPRVNDPPMPLAEALPPDSLTMFKVLTVKVPVSNVAWPMSAVAWVSTASTPGSSLARAVSIRAIRACAMGLRRISP